MRKAFSLPSVGFVGVLMFGFVFFCAEAPNNALAGSHTFYEGRTMRIIWGFPPGGHGDIAARVFARHLPRWIPGQPRIIVQTMPGAGGLAAANHVFRVAKPDGLTLFLFPISAHMAPFLVPEEAQYDTRKVPIIWAQSQTWVTVIDPKTSQVKSIEDLRRAAVRIAVGGTTATGSRTLRPKLATELLGVDHFLVAGYAGTMPLVAAFQRGEIHLFELPVGDYMRHLEPREKEGSALLLWQSGLTGPDGSIQRSPLVPHLPSLDELLPQEKKRGPAWEAYKAQVIPLAFNYSLALRDGVPEERTSILGQAFQSMTKDPAFRKEFEKALPDAPPDHYAGSDADKLVKAGLKEMEELEQGIRYLRELAKKK